MIIVDDGLATGNTMLACVEDARKQGAGSVTVAVPVSSRSAARKISKGVDHFVCLDTPDEFYAVGEFYRDFSEVTDEMVTKLLAGQGERNATREIKK